MPLDPNRVPPPPRELSERAQQFVRKQTGGFALLLAGAIISFVGLTLALVFCWTLPAELLLDFTGVSSGGTVVSAQLDYHYRINGVPATRVTVQYEVQRERYTTDVITTDRELLARAQPGATVDVEVAPSSPGIARVAGRSYGFFGHFGLLTLIFPAVGLALVGLGLRKRARARRVLREGGAAVARVTFAGLNTYVRVNRRNPFMLRWAFDLDGRTYEGSISSFSNEMQTFMAGAQEVLVVYDRGDPSYSTLWVE